MASEIELKLCLTAESLTYLREHWLPSRGAAPIKTTQLRNTYYDTPERVLHARRVALRLREKQGRIIQTLKTQGQSRGGLHQRDEWEWELTQASLDADLLRQAAFPADVAVERLVPVFSTDFARTQVDLSLDDGRIELALDQGEVRAAELVEPILEVELELKSGSPSCLFALAQEIASQVPVWASDTSKAERGYALGGAGSSPQWAQLAVAQLAPDELVTQIRSLHQRRWLRAIERFRAAPCFTALLAVDRSLFALQAGIRELTLGDAVGPELQAALAAEQARLSQLLAEFQRVGSAPSLAEFEASPASGLLSLLLSQYLMATGS